MAAPLTRNLVGAVLARGGAIVPLTIPASASGGLGLCNPSVFVERGEIWCILRNVNYTLYHCENDQTFNSRWGPLSYLNPEHDVHLRTTNFLCKLAPDLSVERWWKIDTSKLDVPPLWEFVGLEDARLVRWDGRLYGIGVRRDTTTNGQGRMELSELSVSETEVKEVARYRIEHPVDPKWYCEKNWMPVLDQPFHFVKWANPAEVVRADLADLSSRRVMEPDEAGKVDGLPFLRGSSQVVPWCGYYVCIVHDVDLKKNQAGQKDATYWHRFVVYDRDWRIVTITERFSFMAGEVEFCCGMAVHENDWLLTFGFQDNAAFILRVPEAMIQSLLGAKVHPKREKWRATKYPTLEVTTAVPKRGCPMACTVCPQAPLVAAYQVPERFLKFEDFSTMLGKVPPAVQITFAGFVEPFANRDCLPMIMHAHERGHRVSVFTTAVGMTVDDVERLRPIPFGGVQGGFVLHLPDVDGKFTHKLTASYMAVLEALRARPLTNFRAMRMGKLAPELEAMFPDAVQPGMYSRAGNVQGPDVIHVVRQEKPTTCGCPERLYHNVLLPNGDVALCCMDYAIEHPLGNLFRQDYDELLPADGTPFDLCRKCENGVPT